MYGVFNDPVLCEKAEADLHEYYRIFLGDLFDPQSTITVRKIFVLINNLPHHSRVMQHLHNDALSVDQHLMISMIDALNDVSFQTSISAAGLAGKSYRDALKKKPKPIERPTVRPKEKEKKHFITGRELRAMMSQKTQIIAHTDSCIKSKVNGPGELNCNCPPENA